MNSVPFSTETDKTETDYVFAMDSTASATDIQTFSYNDKQLSGFLDKLKSLNVDSSYYITLLAGQHKKAKRSVLKKIADAAGGSLTTIDLNEIITQHEEECYENIDRAFDALTDSDKLIYLQNGDALNGVYTSYSYSVQQYATPQERYLITKMADSEKVIFIDMDTKDTVSRTMMRYAQAMITFDAPASFFGKVLWNLKQIKVHGHTFITKRSALRRI